MAFFVSKVAKFIIKSTDFKSSEFEKNININNKKKFYYLKRGTLVYAKLGINIGSEFSGNHFCIVLDNKDTVYKETITVIPLSSKKNRHYLELKDSILNFALQRIKDGMDENKSRHLETYFIIRKQHITLTNELTQLMIKLPLNSFREYLEYVKKFHEFMKLVRQQSKFYDDIFEQLGIIIKRYEKFKGTKSYAHINSIQTISKNRLQRLNEFDPTGKITFSEDSLNKIDKEISRRFLGR